MAGGGSSRWAASTSCTVPVNGREPVRISKAITPNAYWSVAAVTSCPMRCSGLMYDQVPMTNPVAVVRGALSRLAIPKSDTMARPS